MSDHGHEKQRRWQLYQIYTGFKDELKRELEDISKYLNDPAKFLKSLIQKAWGNQDELRILVTGKTGQGKSALINGVLGEIFAEEGARAERCTTKVAEFKKNIHGVPVTVFDSPGLQDRTANEEEYIRSMRDQCKELSLVLYCTKMINPRLTDDDKNAMLKLTNAFGQEFWNYTVFVLTFANMEDCAKKDDRDEHVEEPSYRDHKGWQTLKKKRFQHRLKIWEKELQQFLIQEVNVSQKIAERIPVVPTGDHIISYNNQEPMCLPDRDNWFNKFWCTCCLRVKDQRLFLEVNQERIIVADDVDNSKTPKLEETEKVMTTKELEQQQQQQQPRQQQQQPQQQQQQQPRQQQQQQQPQRQQQPPPQQQRQQQPQQQPQQEQQQQQQQQQQQRQRQQQPRQQPQQPPPQPPPQKQQSRRQQQQQQQQPRQQQQSQQPPPQQRQQRQQQQQPQQQQQQQPQPQQQPPPQQQLQQQQPQQEQQQQQQQRQQPQQQPRKQPQQPPPQQQQSRQQQQQLELEQKEKMKSKCSEEKKILQNKVEGETKHDETSNEKKKESKGFKTRVAERIKLWQEFEKQQQQKQQKQVPKRHKPVPQGNQRVPTSESFKPDQGGSHTSETENSTGASLKMKQPSASDEASISIEGLSLDTSSSTSSDQITSTLDLTKPNSTATIKAIEEEPSVMAASETIQPTPGDQVTFRSSPPKIIKTNVSIKDVQEEPSMKSQGAACQAISSDLDSSSSSLPTLTNQDLKPPGQSHLADHKIIMDKELVGNLVGEAIRRKYGEETAGFAKKVLCSITKPVRWFVGLFKKK